jgi:hypothetical protein
VSDGESEAAPGPGHGGHEYRTPDEESAQLAHRARVSEVLAQALADATSLFTAMGLDEPPDVVELWVNRLWDGLRDGLRDDRVQDPPTTINGEDRLLAVVMLIENRARDAARALVAEHRYPENLT